MLGFRQVPAVGTGVTRDLMHFIKRLTDVKGVFGGKPQSPVGFDLDVGKRISFGGLQFPAFGFSRDYRSGGFDPEFFRKCPGQIEINEVLAFRVQTFLVVTGFVARGKGAVFGREDHADHEVGDGFEVTDGIVAARDHGERRRLHAPHGDEVVFPLGDLI